MIHSFQSKLFAYMAVCVSVVMRCKFSLSSHLHAGFYSAKKSYIVLQNFTAGGKVRSQEWHYRHKIEQPTRVCLPTLGPAEQGGAPQEPTHQGRSSFHPQP